MTARKDEFFPYLYTKDRFFINEVKAADGNQWLFLYLCLMAFQRVSAINKILAMTKPIRVIPGGTYAGKTYNIIPVLYSIAAATPRTRLRVVAESIPAVKGGAIRIFKDQLEELGRWREDAWNATDRIYTLQNKSWIQFTAFDSDVKARASGKVDYVFLNEPNNIPFPIADALMTRAEIATYIDYNPTNEFWVDTEIIPRPDCELVRLTYRDNEATPEKIKLDLAEKLKKSETSNYWKNWCKVYIEGERGELEGQVFDFKIIDELPKDATYLASGLDFGFTSDPSALVDIYVNYEKKQIFADQIFYRTAASNSDLKNAIGTRHVIADNEPRTINELRLMGCNIRGIGGKMEVMASIGQLKDWEIFVTSRSLDMIKEGRNYIYERDSMGNKTKPIDAWNHSWDAFRYGCDKLTAGKINFQVF